VHREDRSGRRRLMKTYQDWLEVANGSEQQRIDFIKALINEHKASQAYRQAVDAENYYAGQNTTIKRYEKILFNSKGQAVPDYFSANHKVASRFFYREVMQANSTLLGNGITWKNGIGGEALGKDFDRKIIKAGRNAMVGGTAFGFYNNNKVEIYKITEFAPLYDEEDGALKAGCRFWQVDNSKPLRATMFEMDGFTEYQWDKNHATGIVRSKKRAYVVVKQSTEAFGDEIFEYRNYPTFPVVPCWANELKQSELLPIKATLDCYDLINAKYANDIDDASLIYWTITNAGGMDDVDLSEFIDKMRKLHAAQTDGDQVVQPTTVDVPYEGREALLDRLEKQLYRDSMALNTYDIANGAVTATQIEASYEPLNEKLDAFEAEISDFIARLLAVAGVEDEPTYTRSKLVNRTEEINTVVNSALYLDDQYVTEKIMTLFGDKDMIEEALVNKAQADINRLAGGAGAGDGNTESE
jgi:hypothetical protein